MWSQCNPPCAEEASEPDDLMIFKYACYPCGIEMGLDARPFHPPKAPDCECGAKMDRVYGCQIDTSGCKDVDDVPRDSRVNYGGEADISAAQATKIEAKHQSHNEQTRRDLADGGNKGSFRKMMQIPATLFHSKIRQTGDSQYWDDPKNRNRHKSCKVD